MERLRPQLRAAAQQALGTYSWSCPGEGACDDVAAAMARVLDEAGLPWTEGVGWESAFHSWLLVYDTQSREVVGVDVPWSDYEDCDLEGGKREWFPTYHPGCPPDVKVWIATLPWADIDGHSMDTVLGRAARRGRPQRGRHRGRRAAAPGVDADTQVQLTARQAARYTVAAAQDAEPAIAILHASYAVAWADMLREIAQPGQLERLTGTSPAAVRRAAQKAQDVANAQLARRCPGGVPRHPMAKLAGEAARGRRAGAAARGADADLARLAAEIQAALPEVEEVWFHGSRATGRGRPDSDWDLYAIVPDMDEWELGWVQTQLGEIAGGLGWPGALDLQAQTRSAFYGAKRGSPSWNARQHGRRLGARAARGQKAKDGRDELVALWRNRARELGRGTPKDLTGACKFGALIAHRLYGGAIEATWEHAWVRGPDGQVIDLPGPPYQGFDYTPDRSFMARPEWKESLTSCVPRVERQLQGSGRGRRADSRVSSCISGKVRGEGWAQDRAVAACLNMDRSGRLRSDGSYRKKRRR